MKSFSFWAKIGIFAPTESSFYSARHEQKLNPGFQGFFQCTFPLEIEVNEVKVNSKELI